MLKYHSLFSSSLVLFYGIAVAAPQPDEVSLLASSHVCRAEEEVARLAQNEQLQEMARALVEFKPTKFCFIMPDAAKVKILAQQPGYIKFDYKSQVLYTFSKYVAAN